MSKLILLIDDDHRLTAALRIRLHAIGYRVLTADCGEVGLELARQHRPDLIVLDIRMPGMDGVEVCRNIRMDPNLATTPVLVLSAIELDASRRTVIESGASHFLPKPYAATAVLAAISALINGEDCSQKDPRQSGSLDSSTALGERPKC